jgi:lysophospholipase L1-like esterase
MEALALRRQLGLALAAAALVFVLAGAAYVRWLWEPRPVLAADRETCFHQLPRDTDDTARKGALAWHVRTDARGLRIGAGVTAARCRLLATGDSFTAGLWVEAGEAWPAVLEATLRTGGFDVRVENAGVQGHTIAQERYMALRHAEPPPAAVLVAQTANDLDDLATLLAAGCRVDGPGPALLRPVAAPPPAWLAWTPLPARVTDRFLLPGATTAPDAERLAAAQPGPARCDAAAQAYERLALQFAAETRARGADFVFASLEPFVCTGGGGWDARAFAAALAGKLATAGAQVVPLAGVLDAPGMTLQPDDSHPSPAGHRVIAARLAAALAQGGRLAPCRKEAP